MGAGLGLGLGGASRLFQLLIGVTKIVCNPRVTNRGSPAVLVGAVEVNAYWQVQRRVQQQSEKAKKKRHTSKKKAKRSKANTPRQPSNRSTIQHNSKSVSDWRRSSRRPRRGRMMQLSSLGTAAPAAPPVLVDAHI